MSPIVDTHQHLWDLDRFRLPWLENGNPLRRSFTPSDYEEATTDLNVTRSVYMEVDVDPHQDVAEAEYVLDLCRRDDNPMCGAVIGGRPASDDFASYLDRFPDERYIKGVRQVLHAESTPPGYCLSYEFVRGVRLLGERGLRFDICIRSNELHDAAKLIDLCPDTSFVLDHCGNGDVQAEDRSDWKRGIDEVATRANVVCKISGIVASAKPGAWSAADLAPIVLHCAEAFGRVRIMFASDWPVCTLTATYRQWVEALYEIVADWSDTDKRLLFHDNAVAVYDLE